MPAKSIAIRQDKRSSTRYTTVNTKARLSSDSRFKASRQPFKINKIKIKNKLIQLSNFTTHKQMNNVIMHKPQTASLKKLSQTKPVNHKAFFPSSAMLNLLPTLGRLRLRCNSYKIFTYSSLLNILFFFKYFFV